ncbi:MAG: ribosome assembly factor SBDS [Nitrososphaerales archaeon]
MDKFTIARLSIDKETYEVLVKPEEALDFKMGKPKDISKILVSYEIYSDASKGSRASNEKMKRHFNTTDPFKVAEIIIKRGELQLTQEQRRKMVEDKRKMIIQIINKNFIDPKTGLPHPPLRIEQALQEAKVSIDPFKGAEEQAKVIIEALRKIIPLKSELVNLRVKIPPLYSGKTQGILKSFGEVKSQEYTKDGSLIALIQIPVAIQQALIDRLASLTKGNFEAKVER